MFVTLKFHHHQFLTLCMLGTFVHAFLLSAYFFFHNYLLKKFSPAYSDWIQIRPKKMSGLTDLVLRLFANVISRWQNTSLARRQLTRCLLLVSGLGGGSGGNLCHIDTFQIHFICDVFLWNKSDESLCHLLILLKSNFSKKKIRNTTSAFLNRLNPDQARQNVGHDLDPICLTLWWYSWKIFFLKKLIRQKKHKKFQLMSQVKLLPSQTYDVKKFYLVLWSRKKNAGLNFFVTMNMSWWSILTLFRARLLSHFFEKIFL